MLKLNLSAATLRISEAFGVRDDPSPVRRIKPPKRDSETDERSAGLRPGAAMMFESRRVGDRRSVIDFHHSSYTTPVMKPFFSHPHSPGADATLSAKSCATLLLALVALQPAFCQDQKPPESLSELQERLTTQVSAPRFAAAL